MPRVMTYKLFANSYCLDILFDDKLSINYFFITVSLLVIKYFHTQILIWSYNTLKLWYCLSFVFQLSTISTSQRIPTMILYLIYSLVLKCPSIQWQKKRPVLCMPRLIIFLERAGKREAFQVHCKTNKYLRCRFINTLI